MSVGGVRAKECEWGGDEKMSLEYLRTYIIHLLLRASAGVVDMEGKVVPRMT